VPTSCTVLPERFTGFSFLTKTELNLLTELKKSCKRLALYLPFKGTTNHELRATSYKLF
jgi:hypothetical protein